MIIYDCTWWYMMIHIIYICLCYAFASWLGCFLLGRQLSWYQYCPCHRIFATAASILRSTSLWGGCAVTKRANGSPNDMATIFTFKIAEHFCSNPDAWTMDWGVHVIPDLLILEVPPNHNQTKYSSGVNISNHHLDMLKSPDKKKK